MNANDLAAIATVRARLELLAERVSTLRVPAFLARDLASAIMALRALETEGEKRG